MERLAAGAPGTTGSSSHTTAKPRQKWQHAGHAHHAQRRVATRVSAVAAPERPRSAPSSFRPPNVPEIQAARLITAIKTPYLPNGQFDLEAYDRLVEHQIEGGVQGLIIGGTTGEGHLMSWDEHIMLIAHTVLNFRDRILVIGNTGSNSTKEAVHATQQGFNVGMHASLQINPYYGKTSPTGLAAHFDTVMGLGPAMLYNVPGRTGQDIPEEVVMALAGHSNFLGVKECTGNARISSYADQGVVCWSGNDDEAHDAVHEHGGRGVVSVTSNLIPSLYRKLMYERDDALMDSLQDLVAWLFCEPNPIGLNTALAMCGLCQPVFRLPYVPLNYEARVRGAKLLEAVGEHIPGCTRVTPLEDKDFTLLAKY